MATGNERISDGWGGRCLILKDPGLGKSRWGLSDRIRAEGPALMVSFGSRPWKEQRENGRSPQQACAGRGGVSIFAAGRVGIGIGHSSKPV